MNKDILEKNLAKLEDKTAIAVNTSFGSIFYGMDENTGKKLYNKDHIEQSIARILATNKGSKTLRRDFGSDIFNLSGINLNNSGVLRIKQAINIALDNFEPRIDVKAIDIKPSIDGKINPSIDWKLKD